MSENMFAPAGGKGAVIEKQAKPYKVSGLPDYSKPSFGPGFNVVSFALGFAIGFVVFFVFYKLIVLSVVGGLLTGVVNIFRRRTQFMEKRKRDLRTQFLDMLEAVSVSLRAGNPFAKALVSARDDLSLTYTEDTDIMVELNAIIRKFESAIPLSVALQNFADRSGLEDVASLANIYATIEGKSGRTDEIIRETQKIIGDKMTIEMEIETMMTSARTEVNIMQVMPLVILLVVGYVGEGFMDAIYTTPAGRAVATVGLIMFAVSYFLAQKYCKISL